jgi:glutamate carboxypeptidase
MNKHLTDVSKYLRWIDSQSGKMNKLVKSLSEINTGTGNIEGLTKALKLLKPEFRKLGGKMKEILLSPYEIVTDNGEIKKTEAGSALSVIKRPRAKMKIFLGIHLDTVFPKTHHFQKVIPSTNGRLIGPGVSDAKSGIVILLKALEALEKSPFAEKIGWEVFINPDEEIGSPGSTPYFKKIAKRNKLGLLFEPTLSDGRLVSERKGSGEFAIIVRGKAAHTGRNYEKGKHAIYTLSEIILDLKKFNDKNQYIRISVGKISGGGAVNMIPDLAIARLDIRIIKKEHMKTSVDFLKSIVKKYNVRKGFSVKLHGNFHSPPKDMDKKSEQIFNFLSKCGKELNIPIKWGISGGASDGNNLAYWGLPNIDTMGPRGGNIHSDKEYLILDSLTERAKLTFYFLAKLTEAGIKF